MVEAAEYRKGMERRRSAYAMAAAVNEPKALEEITPEPRRSRRQADGVGKQEFVSEQWWPD
jgi:hypothetical protein